MNKTLWDGSVNSSYVLERILVEDLLARRLEALGFNEGTKIQILNKKKSGAMIVKIRGTRLALGKHITTLLEVSPFEEKEKTKGTLDQENNHGEGLKDGTR